MLHYNKSKKYWQSIQPTNDGVLGGYGSISNIDLEGSSKVLANYFQSGKRAADIGAGIGRITNGLLSKFFNSVDLIEQNPDFLDKAKQLLLEQRFTFQAYSMQEWIPTESYDCIWCQWVLGYLNDKDLVQFLAKCRDSLLPNGKIFVKENISNLNEIDNEDSSITRTELTFRSIFTKAGLALLATHSQPNFPSELYTVKT